MTVKDALKRENNNLDLVRIILAAAVIFGHTFYLDGESKFWIDPVRYFANYTYSAALSVKIFFFISGLVVTNSLLKKRNPTTFIISRLFRIFPGLIFVLMVTTFFISPFLSGLSLKAYFTNHEVYKYVVNNNLLNLRVLLPGLFKNNFYPDVVNGSLWSLRYEFACYLFLLAVFMLLRKRFLYNIVIAAIVIDALVYPHFFKHFLNHSSNSNLLPFCFSIGSLFAIHSNFLQIKKRFAILLLLLFLLLKNTSLGEISLVLFTCYTVLLVSVNTYFNKFRPKYDISYGIYLWGFFIQQCVFAICGHIHGALHFMIALFIAIIFACISYIFIEQPGIRLGKKLSLLIKRKAIPKTPRHEYVQAKENNQ